MTDLFEAMMSLASLGLWRLSIHHESFTPSRLLSGNRPEGHLGVLFGATWNEQVRSDESKIFPESCISEDR